MSEQDSPQPSAETPRILSIADNLRKKIAIDVIVHAFENNLEGSRSAEELVSHLVRDFPDPDVWYDAMKSPYYDVTISQDIVLVECAKQNLFSLISSFMTLMPMDESRKQAAIDSPGRYGRPAIKHAVMKKQWHAASMLIRYGASLGLVGDQHGIVRNLLEAVGVGPGTVNVLEHYDAPAGDRLAMCIMTIDSLYGQDWATHAEPLTPKELTEAGTRPLVPPAQNERTDHYMSWPSANSSTGSGMAFNAWSLRRAAQSASRNSSSRDGSQSSSTPGTPRGVAKGSLQQQARQFSPTSSYSSIVKSVDTRSFPRRTSPKTTVRSEPRSPPSSSSSFMLEGRRDQEQNRKTSLLMAKWTIHELEDFISESPPPSSSERG